MYIWKNKSRRDRRGNLTDGVLGWEGPKDAPRMDTHDEKIRMKDEDIFVAAHVRKIRMLINKYLSTKDGAVEINHVINEMEKINSATIYKLGISSVPPEVKKKDNVYQIFRTFDTDGSGTIDFDEMDALLKHLGINLEKEELQSLLDALDFDGESKGELDFEEFYVWFITEVEVHANKKKSFNPFRRKNKREGLGRKFKRMTQEIEAKNLIIDKIVSETDRDLRMEFRIAHPPSFACNRDKCSKCFTTLRELEEHESDNSFHDKLKSDEEIMNNKFMAVENAFLGSYGRKLKAHRLLFSTELNGMAYRRNNLIEMPYRPMIADPRGERKNQLISGDLVVGADPKSGIRGLPFTRNMHRQHRSTWLRDHEKTSLNDTRALLNLSSDERVDTVVTPEFGAIATVKLVYTKYIRWSIYIKGEFTNWKPERLIADPGGKYCSIRELPPGKYRYRFVADDKDCVEETSSQIKDEWGHNNIIQVLNPFENPLDSKPIPSEINLRNGNLCDDGSWALFNGVTANSNIEILDLSANNISDDGLKAIAEGCKSLLRLRELKLNGNGFTYEGCRHLEPIIKNSRALKVLQLADNRIGDDGCELIGKCLEGHASLAELYLDSNYINYGGCNNLGMSLRYMRYLKVLSLSGNIIRQAAMERLTFYLRMNGSITSLNVSKNPLGPDGVVHLGEYVHETGNLTHLDLSNTQMMLQEKRTGLNSLCEGIRKNRSLSCLKLKNNGINNDHAMEIAYVLYNNRFITELDLEFNPIATQWFQPNTYLKTKLLAKMPTLQTSLDRNRRIKEDPVTFARYVHQPKEWDENPDGKWNSKQKWKVKQKKARDTQFAESDAGVESERKRLEDEHVRAELFKYAVSMNSFLQSAEGSRLVKHIAKVMRQYVRALAQDKDKQPDWVHDSHLSIVTALLNYHRPEDPEPPNLTAVEGEHGVETFVVPPSVTEEPMLSVSCHRVGPLLKALGVALADQDVRDLTEEVSVGGSQESVSVRKLFKLVKHRAPELIASTSALQRASAVSKQLLHGPVDVARHLLYQHGLRIKRLEVRKRYRSTPLQEPRFVCAQCSRRFDSSRALRKHEQKSRKEHSRVALMDELFASQCHVIRRAKYLLTGVFFPAYYELNKSMFLPRYYTPQVYDTWGEDGRPVAVIEPEMTYIVQDMMGNWIQVSYAGQLGWTKYMQGTTVIMKPVFSEVGGFWDNLETFLTPLCYQVSDVLPGQVEIKVRAKPHLSSRVIGSLERGMVVHCGAVLNDWLQIRYNDFDAAWVLVKSGEIPLMERLHPILQNKFFNIMNKSPESFDEEEFELNPTDLWNYTEGIRKEEEEEAKRIKQEEQRALMSKGNSSMFFRQHST